MSFDASRYSHLPARFGIGKHMAVHNASGTTVSAIGDGSISTDKQRV